MEDKDKVWTDLVMSACVHYGGRVLPKNRIIGALKGPGARKENGQGLNSKEDQMERGAGKESWES